jgi:hypothetical protein
MKGEYLQTLLDVFVLYFMLFLLGAYSVPALATPTGHSTRTEDSVDWSKLCKAWDLYLLYPSAENATRVTALIPLKIVSESDSVPLSEETTCHHRFWETLDMLAYQVQAGDPAATRLGFRMRIIADGALAEDLDVVLGALIRGNTVLFLRELRIHATQVGSTNADLDHLVGNFGPAFVDRWEADRLETRLRIQALEAVRDRELADLRDRCVLSLRDELKYLERVGSQRERPANQTIPGERPR